MVSYGTQALALAHHKYGLALLVRSQMVRDGRMPKPIRVNARAVWDRLQLDEAVTLLRDEAKNSAGDTSGRFYNLTRIRLRYVDHFTDPAWACPALL